MDNTTIVEILLAVLSVIIGLTSYLGANRVSKQQADNAADDIDAQAYQRAREIYESAINELESHVNRLRVRMESLSDEVGLLRTQNNDMYQVNIRLNLQVRELQSANQVLEAQVATLKKRVDNNENGG